MKLPWQTAKELWESQNPGKDFNTLLSRYVGEGCLVHCSSALFLLACPVRVHNDGAVTHSPRGDTWFIHLAAADGSQSSGHMLQRFLQLAPYPLAWVAWHRNGCKRLHRYPWNRIAHRAAGNNPTPEPHEHFR